MNCRRQNGVKVVLDQQEFNVHRFLIFMDNQQYQIWIQGELQKIKDYLSNLSQQGKIGGIVEYIDSAPLGKKQLGTRKIPCGTVVDCRFKRN